MEYLTILYWSIESALHLRSSLKAILRNENATSSHVPVSPAYNINITLRL